MENNHKTSTRPEIGLSRPKRIQNLTENTPQNQKKTKDLEDVQDVDVRIVPLGRGHGPLGAIDIPGPPGTARVCIAPKANNGRNSQKKTKSYHNSSPRS